MRHRIYVITTCMQRGNAVHTATTVGLYSSDPVARRRGTDAAWHVCPERDGWRLAAQNCQVVADDCLQKAYEDLLEERLGVEQPEDSL